MPPRTPRTKTIPSTIVGIDQASQTTGWAILVATPDQPRVFLPHSTGVLKKAGSAEGALALDAIVSAAIELGRPVLAVLEAHPPFGRPRVVAALARAQGAVQQALGGRSITGRSVVSVPPATWRKSVLGLRGGTSREVAKLVAVSWARQWTGITINEDTAEALCLAAWGAATTRQ